MASKSVTMMSCRSMTITGWRAEPIPTAQRGGYLKGHDPVWTKGGRPGGIKGLF